MSILGLSRRMSRGLLPRSLRAWLPEVALLVLVDVRDEHEVGDELAGYPIDPVVAYRVETRGRFAVAGGGRTLQVLRRSDHGVEMLARRHGTAAQQLLAERFRVLPCEELVDLA